MHVVRLGYIRRYRASERRRPPRLSFDDLAVDTVFVTVRADAREAAQILQRLLDAVEAGELDADGPLGANLIRQLRGALAALEAIAEPDQPIH